ncbi:MAG: purine-nucleoside phosphorylase [Candidatus Coatesbacteria bacterium]|nr:MAG: purine-nucleoside phosphorylase [Candidatus Coatesbacteria bacterium]
MVTPKEFDVAVRYLRRKFDPAPAVAIVLGTGIPRPPLTVGGEAAFGEVPYLVAPTVEGHAGRFLFGELADVPVAIAEGRLHLFEGLPADVVTLPVRLLGRLGARAIVITGAAGSLRAEFAPGEVVVLRDHLYLGALSPLAGPAYEELGPRFVASAGAYDPSLRTLAAEQAEALGFNLREAVYAAVGGPQFETEAEAKALAKLGGDVVGMSLAAEALVARQMGLPLLALCAVTNVAGRPEDSHEAVLAGAEAPGAKIASLIESLLPRLASR